MARQHLGGLGRLTFCINLHYFTLLVRSSSNVMFELSMLNFSLCLIKRHAMKMYTGVDVSSTYSLL
jgi:hypothetical protein